MELSLDPRLKEDSYMIGCFDCSVLLLMKNSLFPWFVLVPFSNETEFHKLSQELQLKILNQINLVSRFIEDNNKIDKINIGAIGNVVSQLHVHIIGRSRDDICWPDVAWGVKEFKQYKPDQVKQIKENLLASFQDLLHVDE